MPLRLDKALQFIEQNLHVDTNLALIAANAGLSVSSLQRLFKQTRGQTVMAYIRTRKLQYARDALLHTQISIGEAAYLAGYNHPSNFVTAYKRAFGSTPGNLKPK